MMSKKLLLYLQSGHSFIQLLYFLFSAIFRSFPLPMFQYMGEDKIFLLDFSSLKLFVAASHQTGLDTRSKARRPIKVGIKGGGYRKRAETRTLLVYAAYCTKCNVGLISQAVPRTHIWVRARIPGYGLN